MAELQLKGWRNPTGFAYEYNNAVRYFGELRYLVGRLRSAIDPEPWHEFEQAIGSAVTAFVPEHGMLWDNPIELVAHRAEYVLDVGAPFNARLEKDKMIFTPKDGVKLTVALVCGREKPVVEIALTFQDPAFGKQVWNEVEVHMCRAVNGRVTAWEQAFYLQPHSREHWLFTSGSKDRLFRRCTMIEMRTGPPAYRLEPLTGEPMVLYRGPSTRNLGFVFAGCEPTVLHPDPGVFASIGIHAFALRREEPGNGRKGRDRVTVFEDTRLPIAPEPDENSDARWLTF